MKRLTAFMAIWLAVYFLGCQEPKEDHQPLSEKEFYKTIGEEIPFERGMEWIENFRVKSAGGGRAEALSTYSVSGAQMEALLASTADLTGVAFHYATDGAGEKHILVIPVDGTLTLWSTIPGRIIVDANTGNPIDQSTAYAWAQQYKQANPGDVWFHFFGKYIFDDMTALPFFNSVDIEQGLDLLGLTPEMLLIVWNEDLSLSGRTSAQSATMYDASNACPPCAVR